MIVALTGMLCGTGIVVVFINSIRTVIAGRVDKKHQSELLAEIRSLRGEVAALRQQNNDLILGFDGAVQGLERRMTSLETLTTAASAAQREQMVGR